MGSLLDYYNMGAGLTGAYAEGQMDKVKMMNAIGLAQDRRDTARELALYRREQVQQKMRAAADNARKNAIMSTDEGITDPIPAAGLQAPAPTASPQGGAGLQTVNPPQQETTPQITSTTDQPSASSDQPRPTIAKAQWLASKAERLRDAGFTKDALAMDKESNEMLQNDAKEVSSLWSDQLKKANADNDQARVTEIENAMRKANPLINERMGNLHMKTKESGPNFSLEGNVKGDFAKQYAISKGLPKTLVDGMDWKDGYYKFGFDEKGQVKVEQGNKSDKAPTVHSFIEGDKHVDKEWDAKTGSWKVVSSGPRYKPKEEERSTLKPETIKNEGINYLVTGRMPSLGFGAKKDREEIMDAKQQFMDENGLSQSDVLAIQTSYDADKKALVNLQKRATMTAQAAGQARNNAKALLTTSDKYERTNYPAPNRLIGWVAENLGSQERQAEFGKFKVGLNAFAREYMRVTTGAAASVAELSAGAQKKVDEILKQSDSWSTLKAKVEQMDIEMANTTKSHQDELNTTKKRINNPVEYVKGTGHKEERREVERRQTASGKILIKYSDGNVEEAK